MPSPALTMRRLRHASLLTLCVALTSVLGAQSPLPTPTPINGVAMVREMRADPIALTMALRDDAYTLFRDGVVFRGIPPGAPSTWRTDALTREWPRAVGQWSETGRTLRIVWANGTTREFTDWFRMSPGATDTRLDGVWRSVGFVQDVTGVRRSSASSIRELALHGDGRFESAASSGASTGGVTAGQQRGTSGRYRIDGYEIVLTYDDGRELRQFFCASSSEYRTLLVQGARLIRK